MKLNMQNQLDQNLSMKSGTLNWIEEEVGNSIELFSTGEDFFNRTLLAKALRLKINGTS